MAVAAYTGKSHRSIGLEACRSPSLDLVTSSSCCRRQAEEFVQYPCVIPHSVLPIRVATVRLVPGEIFRITVCADQRRKGTGARLEKDVSYTKLDSCEAMIGWMRSGRFGP